MININPSIPRTPLQRHPQGQREKSQHIGSGIRRCSRSLQRMTIFTLHCLPRTKSRLTMKTTRLLQGRLVVTTHQAGWRLRMCMEEMLTHTSGTTQPSEHQSLKTTADISSLATTSVERLVCGSGTYFMTRNVARSQA